MIDTKGGTVGGGEILQHLGGAAREGFEYLNDRAVKLFAALPFIKILIYLLLLAVMAAMILKIFKIKSPFKGKGITSELGYISDLRKRDLAIIRANKLISSVTNFIQKSPLALSPQLFEYWQYNLNRAGIRIPGGSRAIKSVEFNAIVKFIMLCMSVVWVAVLILANSLLGTTMLVVTVVLGYVMPMMYVRSLVKVKDLEIKENFADMYLMIHYVLKQGGNTPLVSVFKSYQRTTTSKEMERLVDNCVYHMETYGEYEGARYVAKDFREIASIGKLMRLIRQSNEDGDIVTELEGFRAELLREKEYALEKKMEKIILRAKASFNLLMPILIQAILSAMSIYLSDLGVLSSMLG